MAVAPRRSAGAAAGTGHPGRPGRGFRWATGARDVLVEGGATLAASFLEQDLVDAVQAYIAPALLGAAAAEHGGDFMGAIGQVNAISRHVQSAGMEAGSLKRRRQHGDFGQGRGCKAKRGSGGKQDRFHG